MDHCLTCYYDFECEAFFEIKKLPWTFVEQFDENRTVDTFKQIVLALTHPKVVRSRINDVLEYWTNDKIEMKVVRRRRGEGKQWKILFSLFDFSQEKISTEKRTLQTFLFTTAIELMLICHGPRMVRICAGISFLVSLCSFSRRSTSNSLVTSSEWGWKL